SSFGGDVLMRGLPAWYTFLHGGFAIRGYGKGAERRATPMSAGLTGVRCEIAGASYGTRRHTAEGPATGVDGSTSETAVNRIGSRSSILGGTYGVRVSGVMGLPPKFKRHQRYARPRPNATKTRIRCVSNLARSQLF